jgi:hypothetical protein
MHLRRLESRSARQKMRLPRYVWTRLAVAGEPLKSAAAIAALVAIALAAAAMLARSKRVGIDWEHHQFMLRGEGQGPIVPEPPRGPGWYAKPQERRI